jgi:hypothetical protein
MVDINAYMAPKAASDAAESGNQVSAAGDGTSETGDSGGV